MRRKIAELFRLEMADVPRSENEHERSLSPPPSDFEKVPGHRGHRAAAVRVADKPDPRRVNRVSEYRKSLKRAFEHEFVSLAGDS